MDVMGVSTCTQLNILLQDAHSGQVCIFSDLVPDLVPDMYMKVEVGVYPIELSNDPIFGEMVTALTFFANYDM